jgi:methyl-accepting chemotaxis protein
MDDELLVKLSKLVNEQQKQISNLIGSIEQLTKTMSFMIKTDSNMNSSISNIMKIVDCHDTAIKEILEKIIAGNVNKPDTSDGILN